ncbi:MAG: archaeal proteasome endopeptidase complex subunit alpha [Nanoarchaeota archaeon]|nr:archaeal proteasome endopeptidase complex subunit alpha [Nanoarchaeota archaeon]
MAYDRAIVVFSPDGRILQVEYARQMVKNGSTALGVLYKDGVVLGTVRNMVPLAVTPSYKKLYEIDNHIAAVSSGSLADARELIGIVRVKAQIHQVTYNEPITTRSVVTAMSDRMHLVTQYAGVRPYGIGMLVGGVDEDGPALFETEPSGTMIEWKAQAIGRGAEKASKVLEKDYKDGMDEKQALALLLKALKAGEKDVTKDSTDVLIITKKKTRKIAAPEELAKLL